MAATSQTINAFLSGIGWEEYQLRSRVIILCFHRILENLENTKSYLASIYSRGAGICVQLKPRVNRASLTRQWQYFVVGSVSSQQAPDYWFGWRSE